eukprot:TRINITY_DN5950_c0_g1_i1.p1 TRINITY_DN5950_c0_g1~~TRINITY_DN5950_c0_g1_i1.p1  ORF type:complete len:299 (+),score=22.01 TRINITY_DN5950_c0_g1_i1:182-1078(+)
MMFRKKRGKSERKDKDIPTYVPPGPKGGGLEPEFRLQVKLTNIFREPLESTPVYKDLPRLAHRIEVSGHLPRREQPSGTEAKEANTFEVWIKVDLPVDEQQRNTVRYWGPNYQTGVLYVRDGARGRGIVLHLFDQQLGELQNEPFAMTSVSNVATVRDSTRYFVVEVPDYTTRTSVFLGIAFSSRPESAQFIKAIASAPLSRGSCINLHEVAIKEQWARLLNAAGVTTSDLQVSLSCFLFSRLLSSLLSPLSHVHQTTSFHLLCRILQRVSLFCLQSNKHYVLSAMPNLHKRLANWNK